MSDDELKLVVIESPFKGDSWEDTRRNILYARLCVGDCLGRGEAPFASHLFYTQNGVLDDSDDKERWQGIRAGIAWGEQAGLRVVYKDFGISGGMEYGIKAAKKLGQPVEYRRLGDSIDLEEELERLGNAEQFIEIRNLLF